jgi:hypothetical protein
MLLSREESHKVRSPHGAESPGAESPGAESPGAELTGPAQEEVRRLETELRAHARAAHDAALKLDEVTLRLTEEARGAAATRKEAEAREEVPPLPSRTKWTRRVLHPVLIGHAASFLCVWPLEPFPPHALVWRGGRVTAAFPSKPPPRVSNLLEISRSVSMKQKSF